MNLTPRREPATPTTPTKKSAARTTSSPVDASTKEPASRAKRTTATNPSAKKRAAASATSGSAKDTAATASSRWFDPSHTNMVQATARSVFRRLPPSSSIHFEDLYSVGLLALVEAAQRYDVARGVDFGAFARRRVLGAMLDELRGCDTVSRARRRAIRNGLERPDAPPPVRLTELAAADHLPDVRIDVDEMVSRKQTLDRISRAERDLPPRLRTAVDLRLRADWSLREIADHFGVSRARACQLVGQGVKQIREAIGVDGRRAA